MASADVDGRRRTFERITTDPDVMVAAAESVALTEQGVRLAEQLFTELFGVDPVDGDG